MQGRKIIFTGYPGFIGRWQVRSILADDPGAEFTFLVQEKFLSRALEDIAALEEGGRAAPGALVAVAGDITSPSLGLTAEEYSSLAARATEVWHLAGAFDLNLPEGLARKVNYWGTRHVVDFCRSCPGLDRLVHFSSVVVHAERQGLILEDELDEGQELINNYYLTKFWGEMEVRRAMQQGLPALIIRPAGVLGDSVTGETDKFDNVYLMFRVFHLQKRLRMPPVNLGEGVSRPNFVPIDFLVDAVTAITRRSESTGKCFHVVDHDPPSAREMTDTIWDIVAGRRPWLTLPTGVVDFIARRCGGLFRSLGIPPDSMTYVNHVGTFDDNNTRKALEGTGISCPRIRDYYPVLHAWWLANRDRPGMSPKM